MPRSEPPRPDRALPPELDPRGRRAARRAARTAGGADAGPGAGRDVGTRVDAGACADGHPAAGAAGTAPGRARTRHAGRGVLLGVKILAAALSLSLLVGSGVVWASYKKFDGGIATGTALPVASGPDIDGKDQNILLIGNDSRAGASPEELKELATEDDGGSVNTDTMILLHIPADGSKASLISFPRDSYVSIPGHGEDRINAAYSDAYNQAKGDGQDENAAQSAGIALTAATISQLTGLTIDHYLQINLLGFYRISIAIGGVDVCLNAAQKDSFSGIDLPAGVSKDVMGTQALAFVRQRHGLPGGDLDRIKRQQYFLGAVFRKVTTKGVLLNPFKLNDLLSAVSSSLLKDKSLNLLDLAQQVQDLQAGNITFTTIPTTGNETIDGKDVLGIDPAQVQQEVQTLIGQAQSEISSAPTVTPSSFEVTVLNGGAANGAATYAKDLLTNAGYRVADTGDADSTTATTQILYPDGMAAQAKTLLAQIPGASVVKSTDVSVVTLLLGSDNLGVTDPSAGDTAAATAAAAAAAAPVVNPAGLRTGADISCIN